MSISFFRSISQTLVLFVGIASLTAFSSCKKSTTTGKGPFPPSHRPKIDTCGLITKDEIEKIQGAPLKDVKGSENSDDYYRIGQCFYTADPFNKSVSLTVTQSNPDSPKAKNPRDFWNQAFARYTESGKDEKEEEEREKGDKRKKESLEEHEEHEGGQPPKKIEGLGEGAYWTANRMGGAIYVFKKDVFIRLSIGGPGSEQDKIDHCKALAEKALSRL
jgi:hypothetical protein